MTPQNIWIPRNLWIPRDLWIPRGLRIPRNLWIPRNLLAPLEYTDSSGLLTLPTLPAALPALRTLPAGPTWRLLYCGQHTRAATRARGEFCSGHDRKHTPGPMLTWKANRSPLKAHFRFQASMSTFLLWIPWALRIPRNQLIPRIL